MKAAAALLFTAIAAQAASPDAAATSINQLGIDLHKQLPPTGNVCISPYSIQSALAMTFAGAEGATREEMAKVLHYPKDADAIHDSLAALRAGLEAAVAESAKRAADSRKWGGPTEPIVLNVANRLFGQKGYDFREKFTAFVKVKYDAPFAMLDFRRNAAGATREINGWVTGETRKRIRDLIPAGALTEDTRLVVANALYFKAPWAVEFDRDETKPGAFHISGGTPSNVPMMKNRSLYRYVKGAEYVAVGIPFSGHGLQFVVVVPDSVNGVTGIETKLTTEMLASCATTETREVILELPKFTIDPPTIRLRESLQTLGMKTAFDNLEGTANFEGVAPRKSNDYLAISEVFHKTYIGIAEKHVEATSAVSAGAIPGLDSAPPKPIEVKVDRPFLFAIQHVPSGACLFLGRVTDPR